MAVDNLRKKLFNNEIELNSIIDLEVQGIITRSRAQWTEEGERSTKYFFGLEKSNGKKKSISKLITPEKTKAKIKYGKILQIVRCRTFLKLLNVSASVRQIW